MAGKLAVLAGLGEVLRTLECLYFYFESSAIASLPRSLNHTVKRLNLQAPVAKASGRGTRKGGERQSHITYIHTYIHTE